MSKKEREICSMNRELPALYAEELEMRLETDPLAVGGLLDLSDGISPLGDPTCRDGGELFVCTGGGELNVDI